MVVGWTGGKNTVIDDLVARIDSLEQSMKNLQLENDQKSKKIEFLENELKQKSIDTSTKWADVVKNNKKKTKNK